MKGCRTRQFPVVLVALGLALLAGQPLLVYAREATVPKHASPIATTVPAQDNPASSAQPQLQFERITTTDGLSFPIVRDILQDRQGFLWFATDSGLNRYDGYEFTVYKEKSGDPATIRFDDVAVIYEDSDGTLWAGGGGGLDRFDRATETFTHVDTRGQVFAIFEDSAGTLWAGFWHGLYGYDRATNEIIHSDQPNPDASSDWAARTETSVTAIQEDPNGDLWIGTVAGLYQWDRTTGVFTTYRHDAQDGGSLSSDAITALYVDRQGTLWIGTDKGLNQLDRISGAFLHYRHNPLDPDSLGDDRVESILEDGAGTLWLGTRDGLDQFDRSRDRFLHYRHAPDDPRSLSSDLVTSLFEDQSGILWVGTADGVGKSTRREDQFTHYQKQQDPPVDVSYSLDVSGFLQDPQPAILSDGRILALYEDASGVLWIGTLSGGLNRLDRRSGRLTVHRHNPDDPTSLSNDRVGAILEDQAGILWVGTGQGWLERFDPQSETVIHEQQLGADVSALAEDPAGNLWVGTHGEGLYRLDSSRRTLEHYPQFWRDPDHWWRNGTLSSHIVSTLQLDRAGILWAGTIYGGINLWGEVEDRFTHHRHDPANPNSLSHDQVLSIFEDPAEGASPELAEGAVWIGTGGGGLDRYDRTTQSFVAYTAEDGLPGDTVGCILADEAGYLWLGTVNGLSRFDPGAGTFRNYDRRDGVGVLSAGAAAPGSCLRSQTGEIFFGGADGLYAFRPEEIKENLHPPPVVITALKVLGETAYQALSGDEQIRLSYRDNFVSFEFAALDYTRPEKNQYAYRLEGLDRDWVYAGTRHYADYPDLKPGEYLFRVKGSNSDGVWNDGGTAVRITIEPPFWQTWAFRIMVAAVLVLGMIGVYRQRVRGIEARSRELERQVEERTREIQRLSEKAQELAVVEERQRLARDLHDAVSQTLFSASLIAEALPDIWQSSPDDGPELLVKLQQLSRGALAEMRALLMELRPATLTEASMEDLLRQLGQAASGREGIPVRVTVDEACAPQLGALPVGVRITLYRIAQEALNNVVKHAQASQVDVGLRCTSSPGEVRAELTIRDDGLGFEPGSVAGDHLGLGIMQERAESIHAQLEIESKPGGGTQVKVVWTGPEEWTASSEGDYDE
jgi:signal transduction histidine kinase/ligand-binding sensor domain-containing protein